MKMSEQQERAVQNGYPVYLQEKGLDYVVIRADLFRGVVPPLETNDVSDAARKDTEQNEPVTAASVPWTEAENNRRCDLIDKDIQGTIAETEKWELSRLQERFHNHLDETAPPPIEGARRLHRQLLQKKRRRGQAED